MEPAPMPSTMRRRRMGTYSVETRNWLEQRYARRTDGSYFAHEPVFGLGHPDSEPSHPVRFARILRILQVLDGLHCRSFLDVGGSEGFTAALLRNLLGVVPVTLDLSLEACRRARELFDLDGVAADSWRLPFADAAFDVVLCSEVIEHVEHPVETLLELQRVARNAVVLTTEELLHDRDEIAEKLFRRNGWRHEERNLLHPDDVTAAFGARARLLPQCDAGIPQSLPDAAALRAWLLGALRRQQIGPDQHGVVVVATCSDADYRPRRHGDGALIDGLLDGMVSTHTRHPERPLSTPVMASLRCPVCRSVLRPDGNELRCDRHRWPVRHGVPDFVDLGAEPPSRAELQQRLRTFAGEPGRAAALLDLRDRLWLPSAVVRDEFDFALLEHRRGFAPNEQLVPRAGGPGFSWLSTGIDPHLRTPRLGRPVRAIELELRLYNPAYPRDAAVGQVFWTSDEEQDFFEKRSRTFALVNDGQWHTVRLELAGEPDWPAVATWLRLDLANGPGEIDLRRLRLC